MLDKFIIHVCINVVRMYFSIQPIFPSLDGLTSFKSFLKSEFSEENLEFWLACEDYKKIKSPAKMAEKAKKIYEEFIQTEAPKEVGLVGRWVSVAIVL